MEKLRNNLAIVLVFLCVGTSTVSAALTLTADLDSRYVYTDSDGDEAKVEAAGFSLKKVFADEKGDRVILFTLVEAMDNFQDVMVDQSYVQYKGPMGRWNIFLGRAIVPFGLLSNYSTERLLIKTLEYDTLGLSSDSGLQISGVVKDYDYAFSLSQGTGTNRWSDIDDEPAVSFRIGRQGTDFEDIRLGLSGFLGRVMPDETHSARDPATYKKLLAVDLVKYHEPMVARAELTVGEQEDSLLNGAFLGADYAILPKTDLNFAYTYLNKTGYKTDELTVGLTYNLFTGFQIRAAQQFSLRGGEDVSSFQVYNIFTRTF